jgi:hypothetical protein
LLNGCLELSLCVVAAFFTHRLCRRWFWFDMAFEWSLRLKLLLRISGGAMPDVTGRYTVGVDFRHPDTIRMVAFSAMSTFLVWLLPFQAGAHYSAGA